MSINPTPKAGAGTTTPSTNPQSTVEKQGGQFSNRHVSENSSFSKRAESPPPGNESAPIPPPHKKGGQLSNRHVSAPSPSATHAPIPPPRNESLKTRSISTTKTTTKSGFQFELNKLSEAMGHLSTEVPQGGISNKLEELEMILAKTDGEMILAKTDGMSEKNPELTKGFETLALSLIERLYSHEELDSPHLSDVDKKAVTLLKKLATFSQRYSDKFHSPDMGLTKNIKYFLQERNARL